MSFGKNTNKQSGTSNGQDTTSGTTNFNQTSTPTNPDWVSNLAQNLGGTVNTLAATDPTSYIAGPSALQNTAATNATNLTSSPWNYDAAADVTRGVAGAATPSISGDIQQFMDPALNDVVNSTLADYDHSAGLTNAQDDLNLAGSGAFGGSGAALTKAATAGELARGRATTESTLRSNAFTQALGGATSQAQLQQQQQQQKLAAAAQLAGLSSESAADNRANIATQDSAAAPVQAIAQAQAQAPLDLQAFLSQLFAGTMPQLFQGQTQNGTQVQDGTENQVGNTTGNSTGFGFKIGGGK